MIITLNINGALHDYNIYLSDTPSASQLFTRMQYGSTIDGERFAIGRDLQTIKDCRNVTFWPCDNDAEITFNNKAYKLPSFQGDLINHTHYIKAAYGNELTTAAQQKLNFQVKQALSECLKNKGREIVLEAFKSYNKKLTETADYVAAQCEAMKNVCNQMVIAAIA